MDRAGKGYPREASARGRHASPLEDRLTREMAGGRLISYESFLKTVLYDERHGYYRTGKQERRDYSTSPEIHRLFGRTIGRYIEDLCDRIPVPGATILELGGASGGLAADIVSALTHLRLDAYVVLEKGREKAEGPIRWITSL
ncbi:MAG: hypothetical protein ABSC19_16735, partial [Syntrophorhabdales bacterium]